PSNDKPGDKADNARPDGEAVEILADTQSKNGDIYVYEGYVNATLGDTRLQADRVTFNNVTGDMVAEGNVIFDQGADQRVTARRAEINWTSRKGVFWDTTGFTNRTQTGEYVFFTAARVQKTGPSTYELFDADVTACEDVIPKWSFHAKRAELKMGDRLTMNNSVFRVKSLPVFVLPFAWIPATRNDRKSGFLLPTTGTSNQKGRTLKLAYYQTLGQSADITFRGDIYTQRGLGFGAEFRAQTDEKSYMRLGLFTVKDRLFGPAGESQGGTAFVAEGQQFLPHGWIAVGNVSLVTSLRFRQVFSDDISQVIDPRRESTFYANNNTRSFSFNLLASNETTTLFRPSREAQSPAGSGSNFDIRVRQAPQVDMTVYPRRILDNLPIYFSFESSLGALKREETVDSAAVFVTPAAVQRFDFQPKITVPLATVAGIAITPSLTLRETFYSSSLNPEAEAFDPEELATSAADPRLDPAKPEYNPAVKLFDPSAVDPVLPGNVSRTYGELAVEIRPPSLEKHFLNADGSARFKHLIEPYITYRLIKGIGEEFNEIIRFDERDAVANTNEFEYAVVNRFYTARRPSELNRKRSKKRRAL
ncbi:MAG TPA: putative LPS assembly protein LptD, partial [Blastocatellia bacterium]